MASFVQWRAAFDRGDIRRVTWVCGPARVLVEEIVETIRVHVSAPRDCMTVYAGESREADIWELARAHPWGLRGLLVIRHAQAITDWRPLHLWLAGAGRRPGEHLIFVSNEHDLTSAESDGEQVLAPHLAALMAKPRFAMVVRCADLSTAQAVSWARRRGKLTEKVATHLVHRTGGDLHAIAAACDKLALFEGRPGIGVVDELTDPSPGAGFIDSLILLRKPDAITQTDRLDPDTVPEIIATLDLRLDLLSQLHAFVKAGRSIREMHGLPRHQAVTYLPVVKHYHAARRTQARRLLALLDDEWRSGARDGVLEALVALW